MEHSACKKILKVGNKHVRVICDTYLKISIGIQKQGHIFSLSATFNNSCGVVIAYSFGSFIFFNISFLCLNI